MVFDGLSAPSKALSHVTLLPIGFNRDNTALYVRVEQQGKGPQSIALMDSVSTRLTPLYQGKFSDPGPLLSTADGKDYYAVITQDGIKSLHYFDEDSIEARPHSRPCRQFSKPARVLFQLLARRQACRAYGHRRSQPW